VATLAVANSDEHALTAIAGINSSIVEQEAGRNDHLRSFRISLPSRKRRSGSKVAEATEPDGRQRTSQALNKHALFKSANGPKNELYQRVLRVSPIKSKSEARVAVIASGLAPENEVIVFQPVANAVTSAVDEISRVSLGKTEAADADVLSIEGDGHCLAYCTDYAVFLQPLPRRKGSGIEKPVKLYEVSAPGRKPKFKALRFLTPHHLLLLQNTADRTGSVLLVLKLNDELSSGRITLRKALARATKSAVGLDSCALSSSSAGEFQTIVAVATQDSSLELLTTDYSPRSGIRSIKPFTRLGSIHNGPLTRVVFSNYLPPATLLATTSTQFVRLATVGIDQTAIVHTLPLKPHGSSTKDPQYVLTPPGSSDALQTTFSTFVAIFIMALVALFMQAFCEIRGAVPPTLNAASYLPPRVSSWIAQPYFTVPTPSISPEEAAASVSSVISALTDAPSGIPTAPSLSDLQDQLSSMVAHATSAVADTLDAGAEKAIIVRESGGELSAELHHDLDVVKEETLRKWEELSEHEQRSWKQRLSDSGHWIEDQGEKVLKGIFFSSLAAAVGDAVAG
jgi:hypothetical protein